jgi:RNA polymerase sigma-70 factor (ECF subfamily)
MTQAGVAPHAPPTQVRTALNQGAILEDLNRHARARLVVLLGDRPEAVRVEVAADAVQETGRRALGLQESFDPSQASVAAWLHGILEYVLHEQCRALRKQPAQPSADPGAWDGITARLSVPDDSPELATFLGNLPDEQRRIVVMHHLEGMTHEQIGNVLGISAGNSRVRLARAMIELKRLAPKEDAR